VALCGAHRNWRLGALALALLHVGMLHATFAALGKSFPLTPMLGSVACAGLLPECFRRRTVATAQISAFETREMASPADLSGEKDAEKCAPESDAHALAEIQPAEDHTSLNGVDFEAVQVSSTAAEAGVASSGESVLPPTLSEEVLMEPLREECSVMHCEVSNHAILVNALPPKDFAELINRVLGIFQSMVEARGGVCDRLSSDGMRAFFRDSEDTQTHAESAVRCALAIRARLETISEQCELDSGHELDLRFGINSGSMLVASFGPRSKSVLSVAGEAAEWGVRLAGANLLYGSKILLGTRTSALALECVETRPIDLLQRQLPPEPPEEVFELLALRGTLSSDALERLVRYREGVEHFRARRWREAAAALRAAQAPRQNDDAIDLLLHRISEQETLTDYAVDGH
jgi:class 3 adenylate cyclase